jgi:hypothetical protein
MPHLREQAASEFTSESVMRLFSDRKMNSSSNINLCTKKYARTRTGIRFIPKKSVRFFESTKGCGKISRHPANMIAVAKYFTVVE